MQTLKVLLTGTIIYLALGVCAQSQEKGLGVGIIVGEPTGISVKNWLSARTAVDAAFAWSFVRESAFHVHANYLVHLFDAIKSEEPFYFYYGGGGRIKASKSDRARVGIRGVAGIGYMLQQIPIDFFLEASPIFDLSPATEISINAGVGARYFFP